MSERLGSKILLDRLECAWSAQCGACLNIVNAEFPKVLDALEAVTAERDALREAAEDAATIIESMSRRVVGVDLAGKVLRAALAARGGEAS